jgi:hypothetical protein
MRSYPMICSLSWRKCTGPLGPTNPVAPYRIAGRGPACGLAVAPPTGRCRAPRALQHVVRRRPGEAVGAAVAGALGVPGGGQSRCGVSCVARRAPGRAAPLCHRSRRGSRAHPLCPTTPPKKRGCQVKCVTFFTSALAPRHWFRFLQLSLRSILRPLFESRRTHGARSHGPESLKPLPGLAVL